MPRSHPIVLLTDFGLKDAYVASMKAVIFSLFPEAKIVDLTHEVGPQNVRQAAFLLEAVYSYFPKGSIFVSVVDPGVGSERKILAAKTEKGIFLAPDNGLLTRILEKERKYELRVVTNSRFFLEKVSKTFHGRDCFAPTAARIAKEPSRFRELGPRLGRFKKLDFPSPNVTPKKIVGEIVYFDHFGNAFTNIHRKLLRACGKNVVPRVRAGGKALGTMRSSYFEAKTGQVVAVISSTDLVEIAVNHGSAQKKLNLKEGDPIEIF